MAGHLGDVLCRRGGQVADHPRRFKLQQPNANDQPYSCSMDSPKVTAAGYKLLQVAGNEPHLELRVRVVGFGKQWHDMSIDLHQPAGGGNMLRPGWPQRQVRQHAANGARCSRVVDLGRHCSGDHLLVQTLLGRAEAHLHSRPGWLSMLRLE